MPGIAGIIGAGPIERRSALLCSMLGTMRHERFYESGQLVEPNLGIWIGWTAHPNSFASRMSTYRHTDGSAVLFSGECFPSPDWVDSSALTDPPRFAARILEGYRADGLRFLRQLNGLFSGLLVDRSTRQCMLFNDRYGVERLYFHESDGQLLFASEAKALLSAKSALRVLDAGAVAQFFRFGSVLENRTLFRGIDLVPGGSAWTIGSAGVASRDRYFNPAEWELTPQLPEKEFNDALSEVMGAVIPAYVRDERPVGISITGGLDTRMILACLPEESIQQVCYTFGGPSGETLDQRIGQRVAKTCGRQHVSLRIGTQWLDQFSEHVDRTIWISDGCAGATVAHEVYLNELARLVAPVRTTGNFGSEILRGVATLKPRRLSEGLFHSDFLPTIDKVGFSGEATHPVTRAAFQEIPWHIHGTLAIGRAKVTLRTPYLDNATVRLAYQAPDAVRRSSESWTRLVELKSPRLALIPTDRGVLAGDPKWRSSVRRGAAELLFKLDYLDKEGLPGWLRMLDAPMRLLRSTPLMGRHKYLAYRTWFKSELHPYARDIAASDIASDSGYFDRAFLKRMCDAHRAGTFNYLPEIATVLTFSAIQRLLIRPGHHLLP